MGDTLEIPPDRQVEFEVIEIGELCEGLIGTSRIVARLGAEEDGDGSPRDVQVEDVAAMMTTFTSQLITIRARLLNLPDMMDAAIKANGKKSVARVK